MTEEKEAIKKVLFLFLYSKYEEIRWVAKEAGYEGADRENALDVGLWLIEFFMAAPKQGEAYDKWLETHATLMAI